MLNLFSKVCILSEMSLLRIQHERFYQAATMFFTLYQFLLWEFIKRGFDSNFGISEYYVPTNIGTREFNVLVLTGLKFKIKYRNCVLYRTVHQGIWIKTKKFSVDEVLVGCSLLDHKTHVNTRHLNLDSLRTNFENILY